MMYDLLFQTGWTMGKGRMALWPRLFLYGASCFIDSVLIFMKVIELMQGQDHSFTVLWLD